MNKKLIPVFVLFIVISGSVFSSMPQIQDNFAPYVENELIVKFKGSANVNSEINALNKIRQILPKSNPTEAEQLIKYTIDDSLGITRIYRISFNGNINVGNLIKNLIKNNQIEYAEPNYLLELSFAPNDPEYWKQWYLNNIGQCYNPPTCTPRIPDADIDAPEAWDIDIGSNNIVIAVVDSGLQINHPDIIGNVWGNSLEVNGNTGVDDDGNGLIDDYNGWNYLNNNNQLADILNHGTPISGIIATRTNNGIGVAGVCQVCKIMMLKVSDTTAFSESRIISSINYAINKEADIISMSFGGGDSQAIHNVIMTAHNLGIVMVASANNDNWNIPIYPAAYNEVIGVAGTTSLDIKWSLSNYGTWVDISAPADKIFSLRNNSNLAYNTGTSFSAPQVAGVAGLLLSKDPTLTKAQVENIILSTCDNIDQQNPLYIGMLGCGRLNAYRALIGIPGTLLDVEGHNGYVSNLSSFTPGGTIYIGFRVTNNLDVPLYEVPIKLDTDSPDQDIEFDIYRIRPHETIPVNLHWNYQNSGNYNPFVLVDNLNIFTETNENNNRINFNIVIQEPLKGDKETSS